MGFDKDLQNYLFDHFQDCLVGRLAKGIVHNINGPIQILSMQLELCRFGLSNNVHAMEELIASGHLEERARQLCKGFSDLSSRIDQMEDALHRIEHNVRLVGNRGDTRDPEPRPLILTSILQEELDFWKADLFFKHQVEVHTDFPEEPPIIFAVEKTLRDLLDGVLGACVEQLKGSDTKKMSVSLKKTPDSSIELNFEHSGLSFPVSSMESNIEGEYPEGEWKTDRAFCALSLRLAQEKAEKLGWGFGITTRSISLSIVQE